MGVIADLPGRADAKESPRSGDGDARRRDYRLGAVALTLN
jgi:hypothetical protein